MGLGSDIYIWSEVHGVDIPESINTPYHAYVTSLSFSSTEGGAAVLAIGRACGRVLLWSPLEEEPRFSAFQPHCVNCVSFGPKPTKRHSHRDPYRTVDIEDLLVGDEAGHVYIYSVEWPNAVDRDLFGWSGAFTLVARITAHTQQICGLAWSPDGDFFASGGNDNLAYLFETNKIFAAARSKQQKDMASLFPTAGKPNAPHDAEPNDNAETDTSRHASESSTVWFPNHEESRRLRIPMQSEAFLLPAAVATHTFTLAAAIKAIAFCPWQKGLLALGGGSNDRQIHFFETRSGAKLAAIDCSAQVTSLVWSTSRREIAATFGFSVSSPNGGGRMAEGHWVRVAVFSWPSCECVVHIEWPDECRALYAIPYPGGPNGLVKGLRGRKSGRNSEGCAWWSRTDEEGCLVIATSDASLTFHEVWADERRATSGKRGLFGGSQILDALHGIDNDIGGVIH